MVAMVGVVMGVVMGVRLVVVVAVIIVVPRSNGLVVEDECEHHGSSMLKPGVPYWELLLLWMALFGQRTCPWHEH